MEVGQAYGCRTVGVVSPGGSKQGADTLSPHDDARLAMSDSVTPSPRRGAHLNVLVVTNMYPTANAPAAGIFVHEHVRSIVARGVAVEVCAIDGGRARSST